MTEWQNRLSKEIKLVPANQLLANPSNARRHPVKQREALRGSLDTLGWVAPVFVGKSGYLLDGHARVEEALSKDENALVPVIEVDLEAHEESLFLASFDYITYLAEYDRDSLESLLQEVNTGDVRLQVMLSELAENNDLYLDFDSNSLDALDNEQIDIDEDNQESPDKGTLLALLNITIDEPNHQPKTGQIWQVGKHTLCCVDVMRDWSIYTPYLKSENCILCPYPGPYIAMGSRAQDYQLVLVQPDLYVAGHILDNYERIFGGVKLLHDIH